MSSSSRAGGQPDHRGDYADAAPDGVLAVDSSGVVRYANRAARALLRSSHGDVLGERFGFPMGKGVVEMQLRVEGGEVRNAEMRVTPVTLDGERRWVVSLRDVTDEVRHRDGVTRDLRNAEDALAVTSHELRNPLTVLASTIQLLIEDWDQVSRDDQLLHLRRLERNVVRIGLTVDSLLDAARVGSGTFSPAEERWVDVRDLLLERIGELGAEAHGIEVSVPAGCRLRMHPDHLWMILSNFLVNSLKYGEGPRSVEAVTNDLHTTLAVADRGAGVEPDQVESLFDRFTRAPRTDGVSGAGLGLWIVRSVAQAYGGRVYHEKVEPTGARFCCQLPAGGSRP